MGISERQLVAWQERLSDRLAHMLEDPGDHPLLEVRHALAEGQALYHELRQLEVELGRSLERSYFGQRLSQLEKRLETARGWQHSVSLEAFPGEEVLEGNQRLSEKLEALAAEAGTTVQDLIIRGAEALAEGRIKKKPGLPKGRRLKPPAEGPWTPQVLKAEMERLQVTFERLGAAMEPPCGRPSVFKWLQKGIPGGRQDQITKAMERFERELNSRQ